MRKRAIVTGASSGIGKETAILLAKEDIEVVLAARRLNALDELARDIGFSGGSAHVRACDVTKPEDCANLISFARGLGDAYPILINNAGYAHFGKFGEQTLESIDTEISTNLLGPISLCHAAIPWMLERGGQIINVLSVVATRTFAGAAGYSVGKTGLLTLGRVLLEEYRGEGIRVTSLIPGSTDTPLWDEMEFQPSRQDMMPAKAVAEAIRDLVLLPLDRNVDEIRLMPPKGVL